MEIIEKNMAEIIPYGQNPRNNEDAIEKVAESISQFGFKVPIITDKDGIIVAGHTRYKAARKLGLKKIPCIVADDLTPEQVKAFRLADNKTAEYSTWDEELLLTELQELMQMDIDMSLFGFDLDGLFPEPDEPAAVDDNFEIDLPEEAQAAYGEIYQLGRHRLMYGDSTVADDVHTLMDGQRANLLLTDPPYNIEYEGKTKEKLTICNDALSDKEFKEFLIKAFQSADEVMEPGAAFYIWYADTNGGIFRSSCEKIGWKIRQGIIWKKNTFTLGRQDYQWVHEPCLYGWKEGAAHFWNNDRSQTTVLEFDKPVRNTEHPTMKPITLFDYLIKNSSKKDGIILDLFGGSGTTMIACEQNGRQCYMMEFDPRYVDVIIKRWETFTGEKAIKL